MVQRWIPWVIVATGSAACVRDFGVVERNGSDTFQQAPTDKLDILFVIDNSGSMENEQLELIAGFRSFLDELETSGADFHIAVITTAFEYDDPQRGEFVGTPSVITSSMDYRTLFEARARVGVSGSGLEKGFEAMTHAMSDKMIYGANAGFLRPDARLLAVVVSDEDDCSDLGVLEADGKGVVCYQQAEKLAPVSKFVNQLTDLKPFASFFNFAAIVGPEDPSGECAENAWPGVRYLEAVRRTAGQALSICEDDWGPFFGSLGIDVVNLSDTFKLSHRADPASILVTVGGVEVIGDEDDGWTYDDASQSVEFHGDAVPPRSTDIVIEYVIVAG